MGENNNAIDEMKEEKSKQTGLKNIEGKTRGNLPYNILARYYNVKVSTLQKN